MKYIHKFISIFSFFFVFYLVFQTILPISYADGLEAIKSFQTDIVINKDGTLNVSETIMYDFNTNQKHGIYRNIDTIKVNEEGEKFLLDVYLNNVIDESGFLYTKTTSRGPSSFDIKIGDANKLVSGVKTYIISYSVYGALTYYTDHDELYWNLTGDRWDYSIKSFVGNILLPEEIPTDQIKAVCFDGPSGSTSQNCSVSVIGNLVTVTELKQLNPAEGVTIVISFPKNVVAVLEPVPVGPDFTSTLIFKLLMLIFSFTILFWYVFLPISILVKSIKDKRDLKRKTKIVSAWFEAPNFDNGNRFSPAQTGLIYSKTLSDKELTATIIDLAMRGYLKIVNDGKNKYSFQKLKDYSNDSSILKFEKKLLNGIFSDDSSIYPESVEVSVKELGKTITFTNAVSKFKKDVENSLMEEKLFKSKPMDNFMKNTVLMILGMFTLNLLMLVAIASFGMKSAKRTDKGIEKYSEAASLRNFLKSQNEQLDFQAKNQMFFEKLLPYATAFGVENIWIKRFEGMQFKQVDWYEGDFSNTAALSTFSHTLRSSVRSSSTYSTTTSSSGFHSGFSGGSSGGGGGGGGGGSW